VENLVTLFGGYYRDKSVLVTGHTGFKGGWISLWLAKLGANVTGLALPAKQSPNLYEIIQPGTFAKEFFADIRDVSAVEHAIDKSNPDIIFHLAAQALIGPSFTNPVETVQTNLLGTMNLLEALRHSRRRTAVIVVTSDKCYAIADRASNDGYRETDPLGGRDPYSMSKATCELLVNAWRHSFFEPDRALVGIATARGGNVIGGGDYAIDRIVPDCVRSLEQRQPVLVRNPEATRPWQHVLDCLSGYLWLGNKLYNSPKNSAYAGAYNFGPAFQATSPSVSQLVEEFLNYWPGAWLKAANGKERPEINQLRLSIDKAIDKLGWRPTWGFAEATENTAIWYRRRHDEGDDGLRAFSIAQIDSFAHAALKQSQAWAASG
jgi:CDP-glucose 4,6-dehydratase